MLVEDLDVYFADLPTVAVVIGASNLTGFLDQTGKDELAQGGIAGISSTDIVVLVKTSALPSVPNRTALTVNGVGMRLKDQLKIDDGAFTHLVCETT